MSSVGTYVEASELRVYYEVYGKGEPLLLIHGGTTTSQFWASHLPAFTERFRVFASAVAGTARPTTRRAIAATARWRTTRPP